MCVFHFPRFLFHRHIPGRTIGVSHFPVGQFSCHNPGPTMYISNFSLFFAIFQVIQCVSLIFNFFQFCRHFPGPTVCMSHIPRFSGFKPYSRSWSVHFSLCTFFTVSRIFQLLQCVCLLFHVFQFSRHIPGAPLCVSHFTCFSGFSPYSRSYHDFLMFLLCQFSRHIQGHYIVCFSFSKFFKFLAIFQVLQWAFLIF